MTIRSTSKCDNDNNNDDSDDVSQSSTSLNQGPLQMKPKLRSKVIEDIEQCLEGDGYMKRGSYEYVKNNLYKRIVDIINPSSEMDI